MNITELKNIIDKYLSGKSAPNDEKQLNVFFDSYQHEKNELSDEELNRIKIEARNKILSASSSSSNYFNIFNKKFINVAASIAFLFVISLGLIYVLSPSNSNSNMNLLSNIEIGFGEKESILLPDGSKVIINGGSKFQYPEKFGPNKREVFIDGEAFFEVEEDLNKPFVVQSGQISTKVLGTKFNVRAYEKDSDIKVSLIEGRVVVSERKKSSQDDRNIELKPNQQIVYVKTDNYFNITEFDRAKTMGWQNNVLIFNYETLENVLLELKRSYGISIKFADKSVLKKRITTKFDDESIDTIIEIFKVFTNQDYQIIDSFGDTHKIEFN